MTHSFICQPMLCIHVVIVVCLGGRLDSYIYTTQTIYNKSIQHIHHRHLTWISYTPLLITSIISPHLTKTLLTFSHIQRPLVGHLTSATNTTVISKITWCRFRIMLRWRWVFICAASVMWWDKNKFAFYSSHIVIL